MQQWKTRNHLRGAKPSDLKAKAENVLPITMDSALQAFSLDMRQVDEPTTIGSLPIDPACQASRVHILRCQQIGVGCMCFVRQVGGAEKGIVLLYY